MNISMQFVQRAGRMASTVLIATALAAGMAPAAYAINIERVMSPGGIELWLVRDGMMPLIALDFAIRGGANQDPADKAGLANLAVELIDEGAGEFDSKAWPWDFISLPISSANERLVLY